MGSEESGIGSQLAEFGDAPFCLLLEEERRFFEDLLGARFASGDEDLRPFLDLETQAGADLGRGTPHILHFLALELLLKVHMLQSQRSCSAFRRRIFARSARVIALAWLDDIPSDAMISPSNGCTSSMCLSLWSFASLLLMYAPAAPAPSDFSIEAPGRLFYHSLTSTLDPVVDFLFVPAGTPCSCAALCCGSTPPVRATLRVRLSSGSSTY